MSRSAVTAPDTQAVERVWDYHRLSRLDPKQPAAAPRRFDRVSEPIPFRRYRGAQTVPFPIPDAAPETSTVGFDASGLGRLFWNSLAVVGWKRVANAAFGMRVVPSAGNLHPTECHLLASDIEAGGPAASLYHYSPFDHALERRREIPAALWRKLGTVPRTGGILVGLTTIPWRCAWKYGERAFRLCHLDAGHAAAALEASAALCGWRAYYVDVGDQALEGLLGVGGEGPEDEQAVCLLAITPADARAMTAQDLGLDGPAISGISSLAVDQQGPPTAVSPRHRQWPGLGDVARTTRREAADEEPLPARRGSSAMWPASVLRRRRSCAVFSDMEIDAESAASVLAAARPTLAGVFPWRGEVCSLVVVHRVAGWIPGLYALDDGGTDLSPLRSTMRQDLVWGRGPELEDGARLVLLAPGDARSAATFAMGGQDAGGSSALTVAIVAGLSSALATDGAWTYRRLHWQAGSIGHRIYLAAEAAGLGATGLSGFYDRHARAILGLEKSGFEPLYWLAVGSRGGPTGELETPYPQRGRTEPTPPSQGGWTSADAEATRADLS